MTQNEAKQLIEAIKAKIEEMQLRLNATENTNPKKGTKTNE